MKNCILFCNSFSKKLLRWYSVNSGKVNAAGNNMESISKKHKVELNEKKDLAFEKLKHDDNETSKDVEKIKESKNKLLKKLKLQNNSQCKKY